MTTGVFPRPSEHFFGLYVLLYILSRGQPSVCDKPAIQASGIAQLSKMFWVVSELPTGIGK